VASRKEQKEALRREREAREQAARAAARRRQLMGYGVGGALALAAIVIVAVLLVAGGGDESGASEDVYPSGVEISPPGRLSQDLDAAAEAADCELESKPAAGRDHLQSESDTQSYEQNPPTSGLHFAIPAADDIYDEQPDSEDLVHTLEHGRVIVWFRPNLPADSRGSLRALYEEDPYHLVLTPNETDMPFAVAASAWNAQPAPLGTGRLMGCPRYNDEVLDALRAFIGEHRDNGPETVP
jgi:hypothetical protein